VYEERYPLEPTGHFHSSDPLLDQIWQIGVESAYTNMTDAYTDTPWRERAQWWGDAYIGDHVNRVAFGDTTLLRRGLLYMADAIADGRIPGAAPSPNGTNMLDYGMLWVHSLEEYVQQTNDFTFLREVYPRLLQVMELLASYENPDTGLLDLPAYPWTLTAYIGTYAAPSRYGQSTALNAIYSSTLLRAADLVDQSGDPQMAQNWRSKSNTIRRLTNSLLYKPDNHRYWTNLYQDVHHEPTPQAQAWALAYDVVPDNEVDQVVSSMLALLSPDPSSPNLSIYGMFWVLEALGQTDHIPEALSIIRNYYGHLINLGATSWWERFDANDDYKASLSHGWGGSPTWFLTSYVLGAKRSGDNTWVVKPSFTGVTYASGQIPLEGSVVEVYWEVQNNQDKYIRVDSDETTHGKIVLPYPDSTSLIIHNGETIWENGEAKTTNVYLSSAQVNIVVPGGEHVILIQAGN
jgi:alpha-L-rhamnosidase